MGNGNGKIQTYLVAFLSGVLVAIGAWFLDTVSDTRDLLLKISNRVTHLEAKHNAEDRRIELEKIGRSNQPDPNP